MTRAAYEQTPPATGINWRLPMTKTLMMTAAAMMLAVPAMAQERPVTYFSGGVLVESPVFYSHGCNAFQYIDIAQRQADQLLASGNCSVESSADDSVQAAVDEEEEIEVVADLPELPDAPADS